MPSRSAPYRKMKATLRRAVGDPREALHARAGYVEARARGEGHCREAEEDPGAGVSGSRSAHLARHRERQDRDGKAQIRGTRKLLQSQSHLHAVMGLLGL